MGVKALPVFSYDNCASAAATAFDEGVRNGSIGTWHIYDGSAARVG